MRTIFLLCAAFAVGLAIGKPAEEVAAAPETHQDEQWPAQMLERREEKEPLPEEEVRGHGIKQSNCPSGWSLYGSRCFIFIHREVSWVDAEKYCLRNGANLVSIHNPGEYQFIQEVVRGATGQYPEAWIGGNDAIKDYVWLWSDGSGLFFQDWSIGEPDNKENSEKCVAMNQQDDHLWGDLTCELKRPFVCGTRPV